MKNILEMTIVLLIKFYLCGVVYFLARAYIEGHPIRSRKFRRTAVLPVSAVLSCCSTLLLRGGAGLGAHPLGEAFASLFFAALTASAVSAVLLLLHSRQPKPVSVSHSPAKISIIRHSIERFG